MRNCKNCSKDVENGGYFECKNCGYVACDDCAKGTKNICPKCYHDLELKG